MIFWQLSMNTASNWSLVAQVVGALGSRNARIEDIKEEFLFLTGGSALSIDGSYRINSNLPFRAGLCYLLKEVLQVPLEVITESLSYGSHSTVCEEARMFGKHEETRKFIPRYTEELPYSWRLVCDTLTKRDWTQIEPKNLLDEYSVSIGIPVEVLRKRSRQEIISRARAGFFYLGTEQLKIAPTEYFPGRFGFPQTGNLVRKMNPKVKQVLEIWNKEK